MEDATVETDSVFHLEGFGTLSRLATLEMHLVDKMGSPFAPLRADGLEELEAARVRGQIARPLAGRIRASLFGGKVLALKLPRKRLRFRTHNLFVLRYARFRSRKKKAVCVQAGPKWVRCWQLALARADPTSGDLRPLRDRISSARASRAAFSR